MNLYDDPQLPLGYELGIELDAAMARADIERMAHQARCHVNHVFGALISWQRRRLERIQLQREADAIFRSLPRYDLPRVPR